MIVSFYEIVIYMTEENLNKNDDEIFSATKKIIKED